jgi:hypothetical protein
VNTEPSPAVPWKAVALPVEALAAFLIRHPLKLVLMDRRRGSWYPRTGLALRFVLGYAAVALILTGIAWRLADTPFWPALVLGAPVALVALGYDAAGRSREALPEAAGAVALGASVSAIALAGGLPAATAYGAWALLCLRAVPAVLFVRSRLRLDRGLPAGIPLSLASHLFAVGGAVLLALRGWGPWLGVLALALLLARAIHGLSSFRPKLRPKDLGFRELGWGLVTLVLLAVGYRLEL